MYRTEQPDRCHPSVCFSIRPFVFTHFSGVRSGGSKFSKLKPKNVLQLFSSLASTRSSFFLLYIAEGVFVVDISNLTASPLQETTPGPYPWMFKGQRPRPTYRKHTSLKHTFTVRVLVRSCNHDNGTTWQTDEEWINAMLHPDVRPMCVCFHWLKFAQLYWQLP